MNLKFGRPKITTNEKIVLASMFYPLYALAVQLSPEQVASCDRNVCRNSLIKTCSIFCYSVGKGCQVAMVNGRTAIIFYKTTVFENDFFSFYSIITDNHMFWFL